MILCGKQTVAGILTTMPTATLTYNLDDPDDAGQHRLAITAIHLSAALHRIDEYCRGQMKYGDHDAAVVMLCETIRKMMPDEMWEY